MHVISKYQVQVQIVCCDLGHQPLTHETSSPKGNDRSPESNVPTSSHFKQASK